MTFRVVRICHFHKTLSVSGFRETSVSVLSRAASFKKIIAYFVTLQPRNKLTKKHTVVVGSVKEKREDICLKLCYDVEMPYVE